MWYLTPECSPLEALIAPEAESGLQAGQVYNYLNSILDEEGPQRWELLAKKCCMAMPEAP